MAIGEQLTKIINGLSKYIFQHMVTSFLQCALPMVNLPPAMVRIIFLQSSPVWRGRRVTTQFSVSTSAATSSDHGFGSLRNRLGVKVVVVDVPAESLVLGLPAGDGDGGGVGAARGGPAGARPAHRHLQVHLLILIVDLDIHQLIWEGSDLVVRCHRGALPPGG